jgi:homoserine dehydrogenase
MPEVRSQPLPIALAGFGTVGEGVWRILTEHPQHIPSRCGHAIEIKQIAVKNLAKHRPSTHHLQHVPPRLLTDRLEELVRNPQVEVVVEVIGGCGDAYHLVANALKEGKDVVTANKTLIAEHGDELFAIARAHNRRILFEAAVAGGIPILSTLRYGLAADHVTSIRGILNGTTNLILSAMQDDGLSYEIALREAKRLGFAESDPSSDVSGADAAQKLAILTHMGLGYRVEWGSIPRCGITDVTANDIHMSLARGYTIRLVGSAEISEAGDGSVSVGPMLVPIGSIWGQCTGGNNVVEITTKSLGALFLQGAGAGGLPTASAVVADLITLAHEPRGVPGQNQGWSPALPKLHEPRTADHAYFLRWRLPPKMPAGPLAQAVTAALASSGIHGTVFTNTLIDSDESVVSAWTSSRIQPAKLLEVHKGIQKQLTEPSVLYAAYPILH